MYPERFIQNSDYATLKNDSQSNLLSVTISNGFVFNPTSPALGSQTISVGTINAPIRARMNSTKRGSTWIIGTFMLEMVNMQPAGFPISQFPVFASLYRSSSSEMTLEIFTEGFSGPNLTVRETVNFQAIFSTFLSLFD